VILVVIYNELTDAVLSVIGELNDGSSGRLIHDPHPTNIDTILCHDLDDPLPIRTNSTNETDRSLSPCDSNSLICTLSTRTTRKGCGGEGLSRPDYVRDWLESSTSVKRERNCKRTVKELVDILPHNA
jgi:hypothetical protein